MTLPAMEMLLMSNLRTTRRVCRSMILYLRTESNFLHILQRNKSKSNHIKSKLKSGDLTKLVWKFIKGF